MDRTADLERKKGGLAVEIAGDVAGKVAGLWRAVVMIF